MRKINLTQEDLAPMKAGVSPSQIDALMKKVSAQLGETWWCSRFSGIWYFTQQSGPEAGSERLKMHSSRRRNFAQALSDATDAHIVTLVNL